MSNILDTFGTLNLGSIKIYFPGATHYCVFSNSYGQLAPWRRTMAKYALIQWLVALHDDSIRPDSRFRCVVALIRSSGVTRLHTTVRRSEHDQDNW